MILSNRRFLLVFLPIFFTSACIFQKKLKKNLSKTESEASEIVTEGTPKASEEVKETDPKESEPSLPPKPGIPDDPSDVKSVEKHGVLSQEPVAQPAKKPLSQQEQLRLLEEKMNIIDKKLEALYRFHMDSKITLQMLTDRQKQEESKTEQFEEKLLLISHRMVELEEKYDKRLNDKHSLETLEEKATYEEARKLYRSANYVDAVIVFKKYLARFPQSTLADNAQYWIGEGYYSQGDYSRAAEEFEKVDNFPDNSKAPDALLKKGYCYLHLKKFSKARKVFSSIINKYSGEQAEYAIVDSARRKLAQIKGKK